MSTHMRSDAVASENPLDILETIFLARDWAFVRVGEYEIAIEAEGGWCHKHIYFIWQAKQNCLYLSCRMQVCVAEAQRRGLDSLLTRINGQLWMGHFILCHDRGSPTYRYTLPLKSGVDAEVVENIVQVAVEECERFYPAFQLVLWGNYDCDTALQSALLDCHGVA